uniref:Uncharacterized protein n=1 Tax=Sus scrofa TaxID=9823 RepID=A0A8D1C1G8_PIG
ARDTKHYMTHRLQKIVDAQANTPGPAQSSQETIYPNGSLLFQKVAQSDTGNYYTLLATKRDNQTESVTGQLRVPYRHSVRGRSVSVNPLGPSL